MNHLRGCDGASATGGSVMNRPLCPDVPTLPEMPQKLVYRPELLIGDCDRKAAPLACPRLSFSQILSRPGWVLLCFLILSLV